MEDVNESILHVDPSGNLSLLVGRVDDQKTFVVSSAALCLASPVWRAMVNPEGHFLEAHSEERKVSLPDDDPKYLLHLLNIVHLQFHKVPRVLPTDDLFEMAVLCDKYDTVRVVRPWLRDWVHDATPSEHSRRAEKSWLFIAWVFGDHALFQRITMKMSLSFRVNASGQLLDSRGEAFLGTPNVTASVIETRNVILTNLITTLQKHIDTLATGREDFCDKEDARCDAHMLGSLMTGLGRLGLWPLPATAAKLEMSVQDFSKNLLALEFPAYPSKKIVHTKCTSFPGRFHAQIHDALERTPHLVDWQQRHLDMQSRK